MVSLEVVPHEATHLIAVGTSLRKPKNILEAYLKSLAWQVKPRGVQFVFAFIDDGLEPDARQLVEEFVAQHGGQVFASGQPVTQDFSDQHPITHQWSDQAMKRVGANKDGILQFARANRAEGVWFADADLIMDPMTFASLWSVPQPIVCAAYWTKWEKTPHENHPVHAGPQVWMTHPYGLSGGGVEEWELRKALIERQAIRVFGQGACTLIRKDALLRGVSFAPVPGNTGPGLMQGEDRQFCIRADLLHLEMWADGWPDIFHVYHRPEDEQLIPEYIDRFETRCSHINGVEVDWGTPRVGDLVSLDLRTLEPVRTQQGPMYPPTQQVRGRLGGVLAGNKKLHPEIEDAVLHMERGEERIVPVHFDLSWPFPEYRGQRRLIKVSLIDHKPYGFQPVVESEILSNPGGGWIDTTNCPPSLIEEMKEVHAA